MKNQARQLLKQDEVNAIVMGWEVKTAKELAEELDITKERLNSIVWKVKMVAKKNGVEMPKRKREQNHNTAIVINALKARKFIK